MRIRTIASAALAAALMLAGGLAAAPATAESGAYATDDRNDFVRDGVPKDAISDVTKITATATGKTFTVRFSFANHRKGSTPHAYVNITLDNTQTVYVDKHDGVPLRLYAIGPTELGCDLDVTRHYGTGGWMSLSFRRGCVDSAMGVERTRRYEISTTAVGKLYGATFGFDEAGPLQVLTGYPN